MNVIGSVEVNDCITGHCVDPGGNAGLGRIKSIYFTVYLDEYVGTQVLCVLNLIDVVSDIGKNLVVILFIYLFISKHSSHEQPPDKCDTLFQYKELKEIIQGHRHLKGVFMVENFEYYKVFYYVGKLGSITGAAKELSISQPAVTQSVHQLEKALGCSLFQRTSRGMKFTSEGELLYRYVERGYEQIDLGEHRLRQMQHLDAGEVRIGASDMTLRFFLLPFLEKFHELYPGIKVTVTNGPTPETLDYLDDDKIDFGVISTPFAEKEGYNFFRVSTIEDTFVAGRRFIQYKNRMLDFSDLKNIPLILLEGNSSTRNYIDNFLQSYNVDIRPEFELSTSDMIVQFALRNLGVGCVVKSFAQEYLDSGVLFELRFKSLIPKRDICVITDETRPLSIAASRLLELIRQ